MLISSKRAHFAEVGKLALIAFLGHGTIFLINLLLARSLSIDNYESYVLAAAVFLLILALTSQGLDKYALRFIPGKFAARQYGHAYRYICFALTRLMIGSGIVALATWLWAYNLREYSQDTLTAIHYSLLALPFGVATYFLCAAISATGHWVQAAAVTHLVVPLITLLLIICVLLSPVYPTGASGIACWLAAWCIGLMLSALWLRRAWPLEATRNTQRVMTDCWRRDTLPFWLYRLAMSVIAHIAIILLDWLQPSAAVTGAYAAAIATAALATILAAATNRLYARELSIILEQKKYAAIGRLLRQRLYWLVPALSLYLALSLTFAEEILGLFRPSFATEGATAFRILAFATSASVAMGVSPILLKHTRQSRRIFPAMPAAAVGQVLLLLILVPRLGATGAAIAYAISIIGLYGYFTLASVGQIRTLRATGN
uniref:hypothetical protein n=1 Tax=Microbulbifer agarilyticus TaxID=260552 RepID=UPI000255B6A4|nr:hypothetical protein [Microbulbifer agarilyticus]